MPVLPGQAQCALIRAPVFQPLSKCRRGDVQLLIEDLLIRRRRIFIAGNSVGLQPRRIHRIPLVNRTDTKKGAALDEHCSKLAACPPRPRLGLHARDQAA